MTVLNRMLSLTLALALGVSLLAGCSKGDSSSAASSSAASSSSASGAGDETVELPMGPTIEAMDLTGVTDPFLATAGISGDTVVGTVGDLEVTADSLLYWMNYNVSYTLQQYAMFGINEIDWDSDMGDGKTMGDSMLDTAFQLAAYYRVLPDKGAKEGLEIPQEVKDSLEGDKASLLDQLGDEETVLRYYWMNLLTPKLFQELFEAGEMAQMLQNHYFGEGTEDYPTDAEVAAFAEEDMGYYRAKHILLLTKDMEQTVTNEDGTTGYKPLDDATIAEKKALADDLAAQLAKAEDPVALFDTLMHENSEDTGLEANPDGYTAVKGQMIPEFENTALELKDGEISGVVESDYGYHIILRLPLDLTEFRATYTSRKMQEKVDQWLADYGTETNEAYDQIDPEEFWSKASSLQKAAYDHVNTVMEAKKAQG